MKSISAKYIFIFLFLRHIQVICTAGVIVEQGVNRTKSTHHMVPYTIMNGMARSTEFARTTEINL